MSLDDRTAVRAVSPAAGGEVTGSAVNRVAVAEPRLGPRTEIGASPIYTHVWPDSATLDDQLRRVVLDRMAGSPGLRKSNCGGWQSERTLQLWDDPAITALLERVHAMVRSVIVATVAEPTRELLRGWDVEAWANVNQRGDTVAGHTHSGGVNMWSAIYYVDTGEAGDAVTSGFTRFMDMSGTPRPIRGSALPADGSRVGWPGCADATMTGDGHLQLEPLAGKMVVFPSTLPHYVTAYHGSGQRITIAFNLRHTGFTVTDSENRYSRRRRLWRDYRGPMLIMFAVKRRIRDALASVVPLERWPGGLKRRLLGGE